MDRACEFLLDIEGVIHGAGHYSCKLASPTRRKRFTAACLIIYFCSSLTFQPCMRRGNCDSCVLVYIPTKPGRSTLSKKRSFFSITTMDTAVDRLPPLVGDPIEEVPMVDSDNLVRNGPPACSMRICVE